MNWGNIWVKQNDKAKRPMLKENHLGILKIYAFCQKIQQRASGPEKSAVVVLYLAITIYQKSGMSIC